MAHSADPDQTALKEQSDQELDCSSSHIRPIIQEFLPQYVSLGKYFFNQLRYNINLENLEKKIFIHEC